MTLTIKTFLILLLLCPLTIAQSTSQIGVTTSLSTFSGDSSTTSYSIGAIGNWRITPHISTYGELRYSFVGKTYRDSRGHSIVGLGEFRVNFPLRNVEIFPLIGINLGRVSFPTDPVEPAYTKDHKSLRLGGGIHVNKRTTITYNYNTKDNSTFDTLFGKRVGNEQTSHEFNLWYYYKVNEKYNIPFGFRYKRNSYIDPYDSPVRRYNSSQYNFTIGISRNVGK